MGAEAQSASKHVLEGTISLRRGDNEDPDNNEALIPMYHTKDPDRSNPSSVID